MSQVLSEFGHDLMNLTLEYLKDYKEVSLVFQLYLLHSKEIKLRGQWRFQMFLLRKRLQKSHLFSVSQILP